MARPAQMDDIEIPLIEEQVDTGLEALLAAYRPNYTPGGDKKDELAKRFTVYPDRPLPDFDHPYARAFEANDDFNSSRQVYAMVCDATLPYYRHQAVQDVIGFTNSHLTTVLGAGPVRCSHVNESRYVIFLERPAGVRLPAALKPGARLHEHKVLDYVLQPAARGLLALREKKVSHGNIHPGAFFVGEETVLAECVSMPCGTLGHHLYEPVERLMADPLAHGEANEKTDIYALGVLVLELMYGLDRLKSMPKADFIQQVMRFGTYHVFTQSFEFSEGFQDFFRGVLNDTPGERWGLDQLMQWLGGKRFNMIAPTPPKEGSRPLVFGAEEFFNRRLLAHAIHRHWREALSVIKTLKLDRWVETSLHRPELTERMERTLRNGLEKTATERQVGDMMTRVIAILDPVGPLRTMALSLRPDALGILLAAAIETNGPELSQILGIIEYDTSSFWLDQLESNKGPETSHAIWKLQRARSYLKRKTIGFGLERVLYELNPALPCQSPLLKPYHIMTAVDALKTLDALAPTLAPNTSLVDKHIATFIACRTDMAKEIQIHDLSIIPALANNPELMMMRLLAKAQQKQSRLVLVGLSAWAAMRLEKMIDEIHNRIIRKQLKLQLKRLAQTGNLADVLGAIMNRAVIIRDHEGFSQAIALHQINHDRIERLRNDDILDYKAKKMGGKMAANICTIVLVITSYITITNLFGI